MRRPAEADQPLVSRTELAEVELIIMRRLREYTLGDHRSLFHGPGFDYVGLRDWQPGDRMSAVDWPQSSLTNFSPLIVRDFEQPGTASVVVVADRSVLDALRHRRAADRGGGGVGGRQLRHVGGVLSGHLRPDHLRS